MHYFDYRKVARQAGIPDDKLRAIVRSVKREFGRDTMMLELHVLRICMAVRDGQADLKNVLRDEADAPRRGPKKVSTRTYATAERQHLVADPSAEYGRKQ